MKYYEINVNGRISSFLKDLLDTAVRTGDILGDWGGYETIYFAAKDNNNIEGKLIRNGYEVKQIG